MAVSHPTDPKVRGLAAAKFSSDIPNWEFDVRAVEPGTDPVRTSDWQRRLARRNRGQGADAMIPRAGGTRGR